MIELVGTIAICTGLVIGFVALVSVVQSRSYKYRLDPDGLSYVLFNRFSRRHILYRDIADIEVLSWLDVLRDRRFQGFRARLWDTRAAFFRRLVAIWGRDERVILLTPDNPDTFAQDLRTRADMSSGRLPTASPNASAASPMASREPVTRSR